MKTKSEKQHLSLKRKALRDANRDFTARLVLMPENLWNNEPGGPVREAVYRSRDFLVQVFTEKQGIKRVSVNRTDLTAAGEWREGITWDELQSIKNEIGFAARDAVELYPAEADRVQLHNIRHLWILPEPVAFAWRAKKPQQP